MEIPEISSLQAALPSLAFLAAPKPLRFAEPSTVNTRSCGKVLESCAFFKEKLLDFFVFCKEIYWVLGSRSTNMWGAAWEIVKKMEIFCVVRRTHILRTSSFWGKIGGFLGIWLRRMMSYKGNLRINLFIVNINMFFVNSIYVFMFMFMFIAFFFV